MNTTSPEPNDWIDGFLFVANRPILDLLNTKPVLADGPTELLSDVRALERWLIASGMVTSPKSRAIVRSWRHSTEAAAFLEQLVAFRERLRAAVTRIERGHRRLIPFLPKLILYCFSIPFVLRFASEAVK